MSKPKYRMSALFPAETMEDLRVIQNALSAHSVTYSGSISDAVRHALAFTAELIRSGVPGAAPTRPFVASISRAMGARN